CERMSHHRIEKRAPAHARRSLKRKNGGFWRAQFCTEVARPKRFELLTPRFVVWCSIQLSYGRVLRIARENVPKTSKAAGNAPLAIGFGQRWQVRQRSGAV